MLVARPLGLDYAAAAELDRRADVVEWTKSSSPVKLSGSYDVTGIVGAGGGSIRPRSSNSQKGAFISHSLMNWIFSFTKSPGRTAVEL